MLNFRALWILAVFTTVSLIGTTLLGQSVPPDGKAVAAEMRKLLPRGWTCTLLDEKGKMGHPHGLGEPSFRLDFENKDAMHREGDEDRSFHPNFRLHFHPIRERDVVLKTIEHERNYSWDIPVLFAETRDYIVVTSPMWMNPRFIRSATFENRRVVFDEDMEVAGGEGEKLLAPLEGVLRSYFKDGYKFDDDG